MIKHDEDKRLPASRLNECFNKFKDLIALEIGAQQYSYGQLGRQSFKIARAIHESGMTADHVGVFAYRSFVAYSSIAGIVMASKAWVPLNPRFPVTRTAEMISRSELKLIIVGSECYKEFVSLSAFVKKDLWVVLPDMAAEQIAADLKSKFNIICSEELVNEQAVNIYSSPDSPAYLLFTSGSTGKPKAVSVSNLNLTAYLDNIISRYRFSSEDRFSQTFDLTFDLSVHDLFVSWYSGGCLCVPVNETPFSLKKYIRESEITVWFSVPSVAVLMAKLRLLKNDSLSTLRLSFFCGEALLENTAEQWKKAAPGSEIINLYGPTEATIAISNYQWKGIHSGSAYNGIVSIGKIFDDQKYLIIDDNGDPDDEGELCLAGSQVIAGYYKDKVNSSDSFFTRDEIRYYRTGDIVRERNGLTYYLHRKDNEVKISGYRVNLSEIDELLSEFADRDKILTMALKSEKDSSNKIVVMMLNQNKMPDKELLLNHCRENLPWYMVPDQVLFVEKFFYNQNGKLDRARIRREYSGK